MANRHAHHKPIQEVVIITIRYWSRTCMFTEQIAYEPYLTNNMVVDEVLQPIKRMMLRRTSLDVINVDAQIPHNIAKYMNILT